MATGTRNSGTRWILADKETGMGWIFYRRYVIGQNPILIGTGAGVYYPYPHTRG
jgi:hypothetical protein